MKSEAHRANHGSGPPVLASRGAISCPSAMSRSHVYLSAIEQLQRFARHAEVTVLLEGESGTGKTHLARHIHAMSPRAKGPFQYQALSAMNDALAYSELFGHVAGAFTDARQSRAGLFASASGGTLFLDEIGKASRVVQHMLLHAVEHRAVRPAGSDREVPVDVRLVVASNVSLAVLKDRGEFLPDLYARLKAFRVELPPLRARASDVPMLVAYFLERHAGSCGYTSLPIVDRELMDDLQLAPWPDNLRELDSTVLRLLIEAEGASRLSREHCRGDLAYLTAHIRPKPGTLQPADVLRALEQESSIAEAARSLGVHRTTVHRILRRCQTED